MATVEIAGNDISQGTVEKEFFVRFCTRQRVEHIVLLVSFTILAVTGLAQRYYTAGWGDWIILNLGGIEYTRLVHRAFGVVFTLAIGFHFIYVAYSFFLKHRKLTMVPTIKDFRDVINTLKYGFGFKDKPPLFGRFDYRQKLEYWGLVLGGLVITVTGIILTFPVALTRIIPGQVVAASVEIHGYEATLAVITIIIWHLYDVIFRPGIFPGDTTMFTGRISRERMLEEHPLEYAELQETLASSKTYYPPTDKDDPESDNEQRLEMLLPGAFPDHDKSSTDKPE
ncbi:formate dehydrogenase subunit gamma [Chloroflexota bacterium]